MRTFRVEKEVPSAEYYRSVIAKEFPPSFQEKIVMSNAIRETIREAMTEGYFQMIEQSVSLEDSEVVVVVKDFHVRVTGIFREET